MLMSIIQDMDKFNIRIGALSRHFMPLSELELTFRSVAMNGVLELAIL